MESAIETTNPERKLQDIFFEGWDLFDNAEHADTPNSETAQENVKKAISNFENATVIVSQIGMFSPNELIDEVSTESIPYLLLPYFLGKLVSQLKHSDRLELVNLSEIYYNDFLKRCQEYELCEVPKSEETEGTSSEIANANDQSEGTSIAFLVAAAHSRNKKIQQFHQKKELDEFIKKMKHLVRNGSVEDEVKREYYIKFLKSSIIDAGSELEFINTEKQLLGMRISAGENTGISSEDGHRNPHVSVTSMKPPKPHNHHGHSHSHGSHHKQGHSASKPLKPFIITRDATQRAVFGMGYPSLPVLTVDQFYHQRVHEGIFPDAEKVAKMNAAQAIAAAQDPNEKEDQEQAIEEEKIENDDTEQLDRMRRMDEYKDVVRRGDGNRHNRS